MDSTPTRPDHHLAPQRAVGRLDLQFRLDPPAQRTRIATLYQSGCLKARLPRSLVPGTCEVVLMNISGGVAGGDDLFTSIGVGAGGSVCVASQAAERIYRAQHGPSRIVTDITVGSGARLDYLPQETILFDGFSLRRILQIDLAADAEFVGVESLIFGRQAMGETVRGGALRDSITLRRAGDVVLRDMTRLDGDIAAWLGRAAVAGGAVAMAFLIYVARDAPGRLAALRAVLASSGCTAGATVVEGVVLARILAPSAISLRQCVVAALQVCRNGRALPRVWQS